MAKLSVPGVPQIKTPNIKAPGIKSSGLNGPNLNGKGLGEYLHEQRRQAHMSLRQLAELAGVSNPYLSQIERGLRRPSAEVLQQIANGLRISAEQLYVRAGILDPEDTGSRSVEDAIGLDSQLTERQKATLVDIYRSFVGTQSHSQDRNVHRADDDAKE